MLILCRLHQLRNLESQVMAFGIASILAVIIRAVHQKKKRFVGGFYQNLEMMFF